LGCGIRHQPQPLYFGKTYLTVIEMIELSKLSSKGQVVIPKTLRKKLDLKEGDKLILFGSGDLLVLKKVESEKSVLGILSQPVREKVQKLGIKDTDVQEAVSWARKRT